MLCLALLFAGAFHADHAQAGDGHAEHVVAAALDLDGASGGSDEGHAAAEWCALAPGCALAAADLSNSEGELRLDRAGHAASARLLTGRVGLPNPHPPRLPQA